MSGNSDASKMLDIFSMAGFSEVKTVATADIPVKEYVFEQCARNTCGSYGKNHACPPLSGSFAECASRVAAYPGAWVLSYITSMKSRAEMMEGSKRFSRAVDALRETLAAEHADVRVMGAGPCRICEECSALEGLDCRYPDETQYSMEGSGIDVVRLSMNLGMKYNSGEGTITYFALVLGGR